MPARKRSRYSYDWPRPAVTVDVALFSVAGSHLDLSLRVLLIQRDAEPQRTFWALPGGFVRENEDLPDAATRELHEETGLNNVMLEQVGAVGTPDRDPRGHVITILWVGLVAGDREGLTPTGDAAAAQWFDVGPEQNLPPLAFDHEMLLKQALEHLRKRVREAPLCFELLPEEFTLSELQTLLEVILGRTFDRRNFRRRIEDLGWLEPTGRTRREGAHRPARLYRFVPKAFDRHRTRIRQLPF